MRKKKQILIAVLAVALMIAGCDSVYHYVVFPPLRTEFTLIPDEALMATLTDSLGVYKIDAANSVVIYDRKDFKIEIKYLTDYHLNTFEFPDQSQSGQYSTNPFTYGNWIDPEVGYTPNRFTVFKVSIYNYAGGKINFDPENCFLYTDRGDFLYSYGREEKNSRYASLEAYFKKRKGSSGVDDDVFESRMGTVRRTVHFLGKPVFRGDVRDGLIVFDPLVDDVEQVKLVLNDFILGYDENNQPSEFATLSFYFRRTVFEQPKTDNGMYAGRDSVGSSSRLKRLDPGMRPSGKLNIAVRTTNVTPIEQLMKPLDAYLSEYTNFSTSYVKTNILRNEIDSKNILMILAEEGQMRFTADQEKMVADFIKSGGFIIADERSTTMQSENWQSINNFMTNVAALLGSSATIGRITSDNIMYSIWKNIDQLPPVDTDILNVEGREVNDFLVGMYLGNRLVGVLSNRGYSVAWGEFGSQEFRAGKDYTKQRDLLANIFYYALESQKLAKSQ